jgi:hypothetical protein
MRKSIGWRAAAVMVVMAGAAAVVFTLPPLAQDPGYHQMADERRLLGVPNALNVASNLPFAIVGLMGLAGTAGGREARGVRWAYVAVFGGTVLTALGSAYYHLAPDNARLVWDRLPLALVFTGLVAAVVGERASPRLAALALGPLLALGAGSVLHWHLGELRGGGDLRPYAFVQFGSLLAIVLLLVLYRGPGKATAWLAAGLAGYGLAKLCEGLDQAVFNALGGAVSGHTLKHLAAAASLACVAAARATIRRASVAAPPGAARPLCPSPPAHVSAPT